MSAKIAIEQKLPSGFASDAAGVALSVPTLNRAAPDAEKCVLRERFFGDAARTMASNRTPGGSGLSCDTVGAVEVVEVWCSAGSGPQTCDLRFYNRGGVLLGFFAI